MAESDDIANIADEMSGVVKCLLRLAPERGLIAYKVSDFGESVGDIIIPKSVIAGYSDSEVLPGMQYWMGGENWTLLMMNFPDPNALSTEQIDVHLMTDFYTIPAKSPAMSLIGPCNQLDSKPHFHDKELKFGDEVVITVPTKVLDVYEMDMDESTDERHVFVNKAGRRIAWE